MTEEKTASTYKRNSQNDGSLSLKEQAAELAEHAKERGMEVAESFMEKLKKARKAAGLSQQGMADRTLISKRTIEKWETGERTPPEYVQRFVLNELQGLANAGTATTSDGLPTEI